MGNKLNLFTYADALYAPMQAKLVERAKSLHCFDEIYTRTREDLVETDFYVENKYILDVKKGGGLCLWKPHYIIDTLNRMEEGDVMLYMDSADWIHNSENFREEVFEKMKNNALLLTAGAFKNSDWTKRDTFIYMFCDEPKYWNAIQLEAGIGLYKNTHYTRSFVADWLKYCQVSAIITEDENICNLPNFEGFKEHRYDQSVLTNLAIKHNIQPSDFIRKFITCNVNMPE